MQRNLFELKWNVDIVECCSNLCGGNICAADGNLRVIRGSQRGVLIVHSLDDFFLLVDFCGWNVNVDMLVTEAKLYSPFFSE